MSRWLSVVAVCLVLTRAGIASAVMRLAVLGDHDPAVEHVITLLEPALAETRGLQLVERDQLQAVLREQEIGAAFAPEAVVQRVQLGRLLKADLVVMLRSAGGGPEKHFDLVVCETRRGLRVFVEPVALGKDPEADAIGVRERVLAAVGRWEQPATAVIAVPPLTCDDFSFAFAADAAAYARLIEQSLLARPGVLVVELAEARALGTELAVAGQPVIDRPLPLYLLGSFHNTGMGDARRVDFKLLLKQGDRAVDSAARNGIDPLCAAATLRDAVAALLDPRLGQPPAPPDPHAESALLYERGALFLRLGQPEEAMPLCEASLLLQPRRAADRDVARAIFALWLRERERVAPKVKGARVPAADEKAREQYLPLLRVGLGHVEAYMLAGPVKSRDDLVIPLYLRAFPADEAGAMLLRVARARYDTRVEDLTLEFARELRWATMPRVADRYALASSLAGTVVRPKDAGATIAFLFDDIESGQVTAALREAVERLAASGNPLAQHAARQMRERFARGLRVTGEAAAIAPPATAPTTRAVATEADWKVIPLDLGIGTIGGVLPCGDGIDAAWGSNGVAQSMTPDTLYLLKEGLPPRPVGRCVRKGARAFDGRYLWAAANGPAGPEMSIIDPLTEKCWSLTPHDGLPPEGIRVFSAAALGPGCVCAAGQVDQAGARRTWVALLRFDPARGPTFIPLHEARLTHPAAGVDQTDPAVTFPPQLAVVLTEPGPRRANGPIAVIGFRSGGTYYSVSFPDAASLDSGRGVVVRRETSLTQAQASGDRGWDFADGRLLWIAPGHGGSGTDAELRSVSPGTAPRTLSAAIPSGALAVTPAGVCVFSTELESLFRAAAPDQPFHRESVLLPSRLQKRPAGVRQV